MKKILLIDDSDTYIWRLQKYLQHRGYPVKTVSTLKEALAAIQDEIPLVVCCDLDLPDGSGMDFLDEVRAADKELPFILASCHDKDDYEQEAMRRGATLCMDKMKGLLLQDKLVEYAYRQLSGEPDSTFHKLLFGILQERVEFQPETRNLHGMSFFHLSPTPFGKEEFFPLHGSVLLLVQEPYREQGAVRLCHIDLIHARGAAQPYPLPGKAHVHLILHVPDGDHTVCGYPALQFQEEIRFHLFFRETAYLFRLGEETFLRGAPLKGGMGGKVVASDVGAQASGKGLQGREIPHIQGGHPLVLHGPEPPLYLGLGCRGIGFAVINGGSDAGSQQFHLFVLIGAAVIQAITITE